MTTANSRIVDAQEVPKKTRSGPPQELPAEIRERFAGLRLANHDVKMSPARMERFLRRQGINSKQYMEWTGNQPLRSFARENPLWTQRAWEVLVLENIDIIKGQRASCNAAMAE